jgi:hypothetical protein
MDTTEATYYTLLERPESCLIENACSIFNQGPNIIKKGFYMYMIRISIENIYDNICSFCYKIGYTEITDDRFDIDFRMNEINQEYDCCAGVDPSNLLLIFWIPISSPSVEKNFHKMHKKYNISVNKINGKKSTECYKISPHFYDIFKAYAEEHCSNKQKFWNVDAKRKLNYWESSNYVILDNHEESFLFDDVEYLL